MSHLHTCAFCNDVACEVSSIQHLTPSGRVGVDLYECKECGARYIIEDHKSQLTRKSYKELLVEVSKQALDRYEHPKKYLKEQKAYEKRQKENKNSEAFKLFEKGLKEGMREGNTIKEKSK